MHSPACWTVCILLPSACHSFPETLPPILNHIPLHHLSLLRHIPTPQQKMLLVFNFLLRTLLYTLSSLFNSPFSSLHSSLTQLFHPSTLPQFSALSYLPHLHISTYIHSPTPFVTHPVWNDRVPLLTNCSSPFRRHCHVAFVLSSSLTTIPNFPHSHFPTQNLRLHYKSLTRSILADIFKASRTANLSNICYPSFSGPSPSILLAVLGIFKAHNSSIVDVADTLMHLGLHSASSTSSFEVQSFTESPTFSTGKVPFVACP